MVISFTSERTNGHAQTVDFTVARGDQSYDFAVSREALEDIERTSFNTLAEWLPAFIKHRAEVRAAVERTINRSGLGKGRTLIRLG